MTTATLPSPSQPSASQPSTSRPGATPSGPAQSSDPSRKIPTRRISFTPEIGAVPKHFAGGGDLIMSHVIASLSSVFPDGEDFFVRSVRHYRDDITDPALKRQVAGFIGQESVHGREHRELNDHLASLGYPTKRIERLTRRALELRSKLAPAKANLATTAALEHYTATLAEVLLSDAEAQRAVGSPQVLDLLLWHALEENEHKSVAFDVYQAVGGSERTRVLTMDFISFGFITSQIVQVFFSLLADRRTFSLELPRSVWRLRRNPFLKKEIWQKLRDYNRRGFHPDDHDTTVLLEEWRTILFGEHGTLNELLTAKAPVAA